jgi:general secretion pathway protein J
MASRQAGFSVLEVLVALGLLAMVLAMIPTALNASRHALRSAQVLEGQVRLLTSVRFIEQRLADAQPLYRSRVGNRAEINFVGEPDHMAFLAAIGGSEPNGGIYRLELRAAGSGTTGGLLLHLAPYSANQREISPPLEARMIANRVSNLQFRYFGPNSVGGPPVWQDHWRYRNEVPLAVHIEGSVRGKSENLIRVLLRPGRVLTNAE